MTGKHVTTDEPVEGTDLMLLSRWRDDVEPPSPAAFDAIRQRVLTAAREGSEGADHENAGRRPFWTPVRLAAAAVIVVAALVAPAAAGRLWPNSGATATASEVLNKAADELIASKDLDIGPGQWIHVTVTNDRSPRYPGTDLRVDNFWVPYDTSGYWYKSFGLGSTYAKLRAGESDAEVGSKQRKAFWGRPDPAFIAAIPRDTAQLRARLYGEVGPGEPGDDAASLRGDTRVWGDLEDILLGSYQFPADVRAALYRVLATIPEVTVDQKPVTLAGRTGIAFAGTFPGGGGTEKIVIDRDNGRFLGIVAPEVDGTPSYTLAMTYEVADAVPHDVVAGAGTEAVLPNP